MSDAMEWARAAASDAYTKAGPDRVYEELAARGESLCEEARQRFPDNPRAMPMIAVALWDLLGSAPPPSASDAPAMGIEAVTRALGENPLTHWSYYAEPLRRLDALEADWIARYAARSPGPLSAAARVALADAAPGAFIRDTGREPPSDLIARVFAALQR